jgi:hypothetical protein
MISWAFIIVSIGIALIEWLLSLCVAAHSLVGKKGFVSDVVAAIAMLVIGSAFEMVGRTVKLKCTIPNEALTTFEFLKSDMEECKEYGDQVMSFGQMVGSTVGINSVIAALILYFAINGLFWLVRRFR